MKIVVFSDLDGTLLDHETYSYTAAKPALDLLKAQGIPVVLASSKTAAEIAALHQELDLGASPAIVENGAGLLDLGAKLSLDDSAYQEIRACLKDAPTGFRGFAEMGLGELAKLTGLSLAQASLARLRCYSEPGIWTGSTQSEGEFVAWLKARGIHARRGGRFLTLSHGRTKADAMSEVARDLGADVTIALGDAPNDTEMLSQADYAVIVRNDHGTDLPPLSKEPSSQVIRTDLSGPSGWNAAIHQILENIEINHGVPNG